MRRDRSSSARRLGCAWFLLLGALLVPVPDSSAGERASMMTPPSLAPDRWLSFGRASRAPFGDRRSAHLSNFEGGGLLDSATEPMGTVRLQHYDPKQRRAPGGLAETARENRKLEDRSRRSTARSSTDASRRGDKSRNAVGSSSRIASHSTP